MGGRGALQREERKGGRDGKVDQDEYSERDWVQLRGGVIG